MNTVTIGGSPIGEGYPCVIVAEGGINAGGDVATAKKMIDAAYDTGCNAFKWQKRTVEVVYTPGELARPRESPWGTTNGELKKALEFDKSEYDELDSYCKSIGLSWWASCWDEASVDFIAQYNPPCFKIASACITDDNLLKHHLQYHKPLIISTGMTSIPQIDHCMNIVGTENVVLLHAVSTYPAKGEQLNLKCIETLKTRYGVPTGYSGHELGLATTVAAVAMGANVVERHLTLDRASFGTDQSASVEPQGWARMVRDIREVERAMGDGIKQVLDEELPISKKLRRVDSQGLQ